jgi:hypothetical protein
MSVVTLKMFLKVEEKKPDLIAYCSEHQQKIKREITKKQDTLNLFQETFHQNRTYIYSTVVSTAINIDKK